MATDQETLPQDSESDSTPSPPLLIFYSHGRTPPLHPPADLKYDLRSLPNPPKALRDVSDGRSKRLRDHLLSEPKFREKLHDVEREVREAMESKIKEWGEHGGDCGRQLDDEEEGEGKVDNEENEEQRSSSNSERKVSGGQSEENENSREEKEEQHKSSITTNTPSNPNTTPLTPLTLRVSCNCALGHHRSVAFVHELAKLSWPKDWQVEVIHRDVDNKKKKKESSTGGSTREWQKVLFRRRRREKQEQ